LLPTARRATDLATLGSAEQRAAFARLAPPYATGSNRPLSCIDAPCVGCRYRYGQPQSGEGQLGIFEGLSSDISLDGTQPQANGVRCDCVTEVSASFAVRAAVTSNVSDARVATNLLNYGHVHSGYQQPWAVGGGAQLTSSRPWTVSGDAFGLMAWTTADAAYTKFYKDDDARGLLGAIATAGLLGGSRWHTTLVTATLGNLRATPRNGFGDASSDFDEFVGPRGPGHDGWRRVYDSLAGGEPPMFSPHYESYIWAVYLWGFSASGFAPLLERSQAAITTMMTHYPTKWVRPARVELAIS
jgi:hypothetical protein